MLLEKYEFNVENYNLNIMNITKIGDEKDEK
jgi:hypothetical protein